MNLASVLQSMMPVFTKFLFFGFVVMLISLIAKNKNKVYRKDLEDYIDKDRMSNFTRKQKLDEELFYLPDKNFMKDINLSLLVNEENEKALNLLAIVNKKAELKMIHFIKRVTNIEIKEKYGVSNLDNIILYEEHFNQFMIALFNYGEELINLGFFEEGEKCLYETVYSGFDYSKAFCILSDLFFEQKKTDKLKKLLIDFENSSISSNMKIWTYINISIDKLEGLE